MSVIASSQACCTTITTDAQYAATSAVGLCNSYMAVKHNDENLCHGTLNDAKGEVTKSGKTPPAACE